MSCKIPPEVLEYIELVESGEPRACKEQIALVAYVRKVFETENIFVETERLSKYMGLQKYFPYDLFPWEKFIFSLWNCTYKAPGVPRWSKVLCMVARGAGKDGYIAFDSGAMVSPFNPCEKYNVDICANNEEQAMTPLKDFLEVLELPKWQEKLKKHFYHTKELAQGRKNGGIIKGRTNNPKGRDGMRSGKIIFNEVHAYENYNNIKVFVTGLGKVDEPRRGFFTSNGDVNDGPLDDLLAQGRRILFENEDDKGLLPFICCLNSKDAVHDERNWYMANPSLAYRPTLLAETREEYEDWLIHPEQNADFLTKRMGIRSGFKEISVTDYEKVLATKKEIPDLGGWNCTVGLDYAEINDWVSVNLHFKRGAERYDINHTWICRDSKTLGRVKAPWKDWCEKEHCTFVDDVSINPQLITEYIQQMGRRYNIKMLAMDHYRWALMAETLKKIGFDANDKNRVKLIRPSDIMKVDPVIQECFDRELFHWGDCPPLRWATNNTKRMRSGKSSGTDTGNYYYAKIEGKSRKTDPFMALVASMVVEPVLGSGEAAQLPLMGAIRI